MFLNLLTLWLCRTHAEVRRVLRLQRRYRAIPLEERTAFVLTDKRIRRSMRLSLLWALIKVQLDTPHIVLLGLIGIVGLMTLTVKHFWKMAH